MSLIQCRFYRLGAGLALCASLWVGLAGAAEVEPRELQSMRTTVAREGAVCMYVSLVSGLSGMQEFGFDLNANTPEAIALRARRAALFAELGPDLWTVGYQPSTATMFRGYFTAKGLDILLASAHVRHLGSECNWRRNSALLSYDGQLETVEAELQRQQYVDVEVTIDVEGLHLDLLKDGRVKYIETPGARQDFITKATGALAALSPQQLLESSAAQRKLQLAADPATPFDPRFTIRLSRMGIVGISQDRRLRRLVLTGFVAKTDRYVDPQLLVDARQYGQAYVSVSPSFAFACICNSNAAYRADGESRGRALREILAQAQLADIAYIHDGGWAEAMTLTLAQLERLIAVKDDRLIQIRGNYGMVATGGLNVTPDGSAGTLPTPAPLAPIITSNLQVASDTIFDWAERLPNSPVGVSSGVSQSAQGYRFRYYPASNSYLGVSETNMPRVVYLGSASDGKALDLGPMLDWLNQAAPIQAGPSPAN